MSISPIVYSHGSVASPGGPDGPSRVEHKELLDLLVLTDTEGVGGGCRGCSDPLFVVRCDVCNLPAGRCRCVTGRDY